METELRDSMKVFKILPIYKRIDFADKTNSKPASILTLLSKVLQQVRVSRNI